MIEILAIIATLLWRSLPMLYLFGTALWEIYSISSFRKKNGAVIWRPKQKKIEQVGTSIILLLVPAFIIWITIILGPISYPLMFISIYVLSTSISGVLKNVYTGIYQTRIVGNQFVSEWKQIENVIFDEDNIRLVDKTRGAIEFPMAPETLLEIKPLIEKRYAQIS